MYDSRPPFYLGNTWKQKLECEFRQASPNCKTEGGYCTCIRKHVSLDINLCINCWNCTVLIELS